MDYKNGKIYKITDIAYTKCYIGSTAQPLSKRFSKHKTDYKVWLNGKRNKVSVFDLFEEYGVENCKIELIENYECNSRNELERKEGEHIKNTDCVNKVIAGRTMKQYQQDNKETIAEQQRHWREENKEKKAEQDRLYQHNNKERISEQRSQKHVCECGSEYTLRNRSRHFKSKHHVAFTQNNEAH